MAGADYIRYMQADITEDITEDNAGNGFSDPDPQDTTIAPGNVGRLSIMLDDPLHVRTIDLRVSFDVTITATTIIVGDPTSGVQDLPGLQQDLRLRPNPFNPRTEIGFDLDRSGWIELAVYDLRGRQVVVLHQGNAPAGPFTRSWDGLDSRGLAQPGGVYLFRLATSVGRTGIKGVLLK